MLQELQGNYESGLVLLSLVVAMVGAYISLDIAQHIARTSRDMRIPWLFTGAVTFGMSLWSVHFIWVNALHVHIPILENGSATFLSILPVVLASMVAFYMINKGVITYIQVFLAGVIISAGMIVMQIVARTALVMPGVELRFHAVYLFLASFVAFLLAVGSIRLLRKIQQHRSRLRKIGSAIGLGIAITLLYYIGTKAMPIYVRDTKVFTATPFSDNTALVLNVTIMMTVLLAAVLLLGRVENLSMQRLAYYDILTNLPNRRYFIQKYDDLLKGTAKQKGVISCILFDVDHFKWINDTFGYEAGDEFLKQIAKEIRDHAHPTTVVARLDGNRFGLLYRKGKTVEDLQERLESIQESFRGIPFDLGQLEFRPTLSIGASMKEYDNPSYTSLFSHAERALHFAKGNGRNNIQIYNKDIHSNEREHQLLNGMKHAMKRGEFSLYYQPTVSAHPLHYQRAEVLIRWFSEELGQVSPGEFIPLAERSGLITELTEWIVRTALIQLKAWDKEQASIRQLSINISAIHFQYGNVYDLMKRLTDEIEIHPSRIELEITETSVMKNMSQAVATLHQLRELGFRIALDDFGTGLSSLNYLQMLPIDTLKIDQTFVQDIAHDTKKQAIVETIIRLAKHLGMEIVVEGIEENVQCLLMQSYGCDYLQGYYFAKPMRAEELSAVYERNAAQLV